MKFLVGKAEEKECLISQAKRLIFFGDDAQDIVQFAVMSGKYLAATSCPYLNLKSKNSELTVDIKGHDTPQRNAYDIFEKTPYLYRTRASKRPNARSNVCSRVLIPEDASRMARAPRSPCKWETA
jgi:hypothetical protein